MTITGDMFFSSLLQKTLNSDQIYRVKTTTSRVESLDKCVLRKKLTFRRGKKNKCHIARTTNTHSLSIFEARPFSLQSVSIISRSAGNIIVFIHNILE